MTTHQLSYKGIVINVTGTFYRGGWSEWDEMPVVTTFEIEKITANGLDLTEIFEQDLNEIENLIIETHYS